jgi:hypothetical protein
MGFRQFNNIIPVTRKQRVMKENIFRQQSFSCARFFGRFVQQYMIFDGDADITRKNKIRDRAQTTGRGYWKCRKQRSWPVQPVNIAAVAFCTSYVQPSMAQTEATSLEWISLSSNTWPAAIAVLSLYRKQKNCSLSGL